MHSWDIVLTRFKCTSGLRRPSLISSLYHSHESGIKHFCCKFSAHDLYHAISFLHKGQGIGNLHNKLFFNCSTTWRTLVSESSLKLFHLFCLEHDFILMTLPGYEALLFVWRYCYFYAPPPLWKRRGILLCTCRSVCRSVGMSVGMSVGRYVGIP